MGGDAHPLPDFMLASSAGSLEILVFLRFHIHTSQLSRKNFGNMELKFGFCSNFCFPDNDKTVRFENTKTLNIFLFNFHLKFMDLGPICYSTFNLQRNLLENLSHLDQFNTLNCTKKVLFM